MLMIDDSHPDVEEFINVKRDLKRINHANLSVCVSDPFMAAVKADAPWDLVWNGEVKKTIRARDLWSQICQAAWSAGEPGLVFIDRYNTEINKMLRDPQLVKDKLTPVGIEATGTTPERCMEMLKADLAKYIKVAKDANIRPE